MVDTLTQKILFTYVV